MTARQNKNETELFSASSVWADEQTTVCQIQHSFFDSPYTCGSALLVRLGMRPAMNAKKDRAAEEEDAGILRPILA